MPKQEATSLLQSLLSKNLRVTTTDGRMFWGSFKCTDYESNIVLQHTYEYRHPSPVSVAAAQRVTTTDNISHPTTFNVEMTSRYLGLVVVPGKYIVKMEVEEFASQMKKNTQPHQQSTAAATTTVI
ncbi:LSM domain-containing protein [Apodospora peruviana]|uniref:LSM domain-containing protein n=1 Tax=Apodospora peruviana TaxID=516989 RepID=A0AAE0IRA9_9PEZI|nr:LSM domain-containing protein [Apodospora peruviana]